MKSLLPWLIPVLLVACIAYTAWRFWRILPFPPLGKSIAVAVYLLSFLLIFPHYLFGDRMPIGLARATYVIGTSWMIFFLYALLLFLLLGACRRLHLIPASLLEHSTAGSALVLGTITLLLCAGGIHFHHKHREVLDVKTEKPLEKQLTLVLASDLHAGYHIGREEIGRWARLFNKEKPDLVLFAGDILDGSLRPVLEGHFEDVFRDIQAPVYACLGNHEYLAGRARAEAFLSDAGIHLLKDSALTVQGIRIVGRDDRSNPNRAALKDLFAADSVFTLLLDHQPSHLEEAEAAGVDFQFSGHTHYGQVWPGNWVTRALFEKAAGAYRRGGTQYYISSGLGLWGGRFRIGTRSEYLVIHLHN